MTLNPLVVLVAFLAHYRLTILVVADKITEPPREWLIKRLQDRDHFSLAWLLGCQWCAGLWLAVPVAWSAIAWSNGWGWQLAALTLAASGVTGFLASYASPDS